MNPLLKLKGMPPLPEIGKDIYLPEWLMDLWPRRGMGALYRDIGRDLADFAQYGRIRDMLGAAVDTETYRASSSTLKTEDPRYRSAKSNWKLSM